MPHIRNKSVVPEQSHARIRQKVRFDADEQCQVVFTSGPILTLDAHTGSSISFDTAGEHPFKVVYPQQVTAAPTGDIIVP